MAKWLEINSSVDSHTALLPLTLKCGPMTFLFVYERIIQLGYTLIDQVRSSDIQPPFPIWCLISYWHGLHKLSTSSEVRTADDLCQFPARLLKELFMLFPSPFLAISKD